MSDNINEKISSPYLRGDLFTQNDVDRLHKIQLLALLEVHRICVKYNLRYYLLYGTLIGAVRHHGFIPWDDDVDIGMLREDYDKFIDLCNTELSSKFFLQTYHTDNAYAKHMTRVLVNGTIVNFDCYVNCTNLRQSIFIDIFPIENAPYGKILRKIQKYSIYYLRTLLFYKANPNPNLDCIWKKIVSSIILLKLPFNNLDNWYNFLGKIVTKYNSKNTKNVLIPYGEIYENNIYDRSLFEKTSYVNFEGFLLMAPLNPDVHLSKVYGDYMTAPKNPKMPFEILNLDFGEYSNDNILSDCIDTYKNFKSDVLHNNTR